MMDSNTVNDERTDNTKKRNIEDLQLTTNAMLNIKRLKVSLDTLEHKVNQEHFDKVFDDLDSSLTKSIIELCKLHKKSSTLLKECPVCLEAPIQEPHALFCGHILCTTCCSDMENLDYDEEIDKADEDESDFEGDENGYYICPICRDRKGRSNFRRIYL